MKQRKVVAEGIWIHGFNVLEVVLRLRSRPVFEIIVANGARSPEVSALLELVSSAGIAAEVVPRSELDRRVGPGSNGIAARVGRRPAATLLELLGSEPKGNRFVVVLDGIEDPRNFGAILRSAEAFSATGVILPNDRQAPLSGVAIKASAGASETVRLVPVVNIRATLGSLREDGFWIWGADAKGTPCQAIDFRGDVAIVLGHEGEGLRRLTRESCDGIVSVPISSRVESLNVSTAAAILAYEVGRQRRIAGSAERAEILPRHGS